MENTLFIQPHIKTWFYLYLIYALHCNPDNTIIFLFV